jgi:hypothetical protein
MADFRRLIVDIELPEGLSPRDAFRVMADGAIPGDDDSGHVSTADGVVSWRSRAPGDGVELDRRQREAAAELLMAFDLPQPMTEAAITMLEAATVLPGMKMGSLGGRRAHLERAREIIDGMLSEG